MGEYADIKLKRFRKGILLWLEQKGDITVEVGGNHLKVRFRDGQIFPIPHHRVINKFIVKSFMKQVTDRQYCSRIEFDERL